MKTHPSIEAATEEARGLAKYMREPFAVCHSDEFNTFTVHRRATAETGVHGLPKLLVRNDGVVEHYNELGQAVSPDGKSLRRRNYE
jgi:hypothetical protein